MDDARKPAGSSTSGPGTHPNGARSPREYPVHPSTDPPPTTPSGRRRPWSAGAGRIERFGRRETDLVRFELHRVTRPLRVGHRTFAGPAVAAAIAGVVVCACVVRLLALGASPWIAGTVLGAIAGAVAAGLAALGRRRLARADGMGRDRGPRLRPAEDPAIGAGPTIGDDGAAATPAPVDEEREELP